MAVDQLNLSNELAVLKERVEQTQNKLCNWLDTEFPQLTDKHDNLHKYKEEKRKLLESLAEKQQKSTGAAQRRGDLCKRLEELKTELERLYAVSQELHKTNDKQQQDIQLIQHNMKTTKQEMEAPTKAKEKLKYLAKASGVFESALGLSFKKVKGRKIQVIFTHIDEKDPLQPCYFILNLSGENREYIVSDPEPPIKGLEEMVTRLNATNNLRQFVIDIRQAFKHVLMGQTNS